MSVSLREVLGVLRYAEIEVNKWLSLNIADNDTDNADTAWMVLEKIQKAIKKLEKATPTFSGGEKKGEIIDKSKAVGCVKCIKEKIICLVGRCSFKPKPTKQKEYCECKEPLTKTGKIAYTRICQRCFREIKPIPAEKK